MNKQIKKDTLSLKETKTIGTSGSDKVNAKLSYKPGGHLKTYHDFIGEDSEYDLLRDRFIKVNGVQVF